MTFSLPRVLDVQLFIADRFLLIYELLPGQNPPGRVGTALGGGDVTGGGPHSYWYSGILGYVHQQSCTPAFTPACTYFHQHTCPITPVHMYALITAHPSPHLQTPAQASSWPGPLPGTSALCRTRRRGGSCMSVLQAEGDLYCPLATYVPVQASV